MWSSVVSAVVLVVFIHNVSGNTAGHAVEVILSGVGSPANASMLLFRDSNYTEPYPTGPVRLPVGSVLYVGVSVQDTDPSLVLVLDQCYATHTPDPDGPERHFFIQDQCSSDRRQVTVVESGSSSQARFSALYRFQGDNRDVYLHCSLHLCDKRASSCSPACTGRRVRSVSTSVPVKPLNIGPIPRKPSSSAAQFPCGGALCPLGQDCIADAGGAPRCADPCDHYTVLNDRWRSTGNRGGDTGHCDMGGDWHGWYRLRLGQRDAEIPTACVEMDRCGASVPLWLNQSNPALWDGIVQSSVCGHWVDGCCMFPLPPIHVKNCLNYYVYKLAVPSVCNAAYCAADYQPLLPSSASQLICGQTQIRIGLRLSRPTSGFSAFSGHPDHPACSSNTQHSKQQDGWVWYLLERRADACGNALTINGTHAIYSNSVFFHIDNAATPVNFLFSCAYPLGTETNLDGAIGPY